jgi:hypothetical protein
MMHSILRYQIATGSAGLIVAFGLLVAPEPRLPQAELAACREAPAAECLAGLGLRLALAEHRPPAYSAAVDALAVMGRVEDAFALEVRLLTRNGRSREEAERAAQRRLASHRLAAALRSGAGLDEALRSAPGADHGSIWIAALDLLGTEPAPYGIDVPHRKHPDTALSGLVSDMADRIEAMAGGKPSRARALHLGYAAELRAAIGDRAGARAALSEIPIGKLFTNPSVELLRLVGPETVLPEPGNEDAVHPLVWLAAARAERDPALTIRDLAVAFVAYSRAGGPWPDFTGLGRVVQAAVDSGQASSGLALAREMAELARTTEYPFQVFGNIHAARALLTAGAPRHEVRASLDAAVSLFPDDAEEHIADGVIGGPVYWRDSGLEAEARRSIASLRARTDDLEAVPALMTNIEHPFGAWSEVIGPDIPTGHYPQLLAWASADLTPPDLAFVEAQLAAEILRGDATPEQDAWARSAAVRLARHDLGNGGTSLPYFAILRAARASDDPELERTALARLAEEVLERRDGFDFIRAGLAYFLFDLREN